MTYQDEIIKRLTDNLEDAIKRHLNHPCIYNAQLVARAKHEIMEFLHAK